MKLEIFKDLKFWLVWMLIWLIGFIFFGLWIQREHRELEQAITKRAEERKIESNENLRILKEVQEFQHRMEATKEILLDNRKVWSEQVGRVLEKVDNLDKKIGEGIMNKKGNQ